MVQKCTLKRRIIMANKGKTLIPETKVEEAVLAPAATKETVTAERLPTGFVDYNKANSMDIAVPSGLIRLQLVQTKESKQYNAVLKAVNPDGTLGKLIGYFGCRKDGKGI